MDRTKRVVQAFLNSAEKYFHDKRIIEDNANDHGKKPDSSTAFYVRDITKFDMNNILAYAFNTIDWDLFKIMPDTALNAALQIATQTLDNGKFQNKIDAKTYSTLLKILALKAKERGL